MTDSNRGVVREIHWSNLAALFALAVVLVGTGAGFKWTGVLPTFAGFGRAPSTPLLEAAGIGVLFAGTGLAVHHAATRVEGFGGLFGRVWGGVFVTWTAACGLVALVVAVTTGGYTAGGHLVAGVNGASVGVVRGVLFGWVVAVAAVVAAGAIAVEIVTVIALKAGDRLSDPAELEAAFGSPGEIGRLFLSDHLLAFEVTSIVLLVAAIGGVILGSAMPREPERSES